ncbi:hypothetical protein WMY93_032253 [Mugilogobius chulae]|uniref:Uncharacterized protein n=1 Tax=Mugilogobius chulae TaxID=88201 RepID=A0AAW0MDA4_9GOBI
MEDVRAEVEPGPEQDSGRSKAGPSGLSLKSDQSKGHGINFRDGRSSSSASRADCLSTDLTRLHGDKVKLQNAPDKNCLFSWTVSENGDVRAEVEPGPEQDSGRSKAGPSGLSLKSDWSKGHDINFRDGRSSSSAPRFNLRCKDENIIPASIYIKNPIPTNNAHNIIQKARKALLQERIRITVNTLENMDRTLKEDTEHFKTRFPTDNDNQIEAHLKRIHEQEFTVSKKRQITKLEKLMEKKRIKENRIRTETNVNVRAEVEPGPEQDSGRSKAGPSGLSLKSDRSKGHGINFRDGRSSSSASRSEDRSVLIGQEPQTELDTIFQV